LIFVGNDERIRVLVADSQRLVAEALAGVLQRYVDLQILDDLPTTGPAVVDLARVYRPDVVVLDYWITDMEGPAVIRRILSKTQGCEVVVTSWFHGPREIQTSLAAGAVAFLPKSVSVERLAEGIREAHSGQKPVFPEEIGRMLQTISAKTAEVAEVARRFETLTNREIYVLKVLSRGISIENAAKEMLVSQSTLKAHVRNILKKTGARSHSEAVALALYCGMIQI